MFKTKLQITTMDLAQHFLDDALLQFQKTKALADKSFAQLENADFLKTPEAESNSIAIIIKHMHGNMLSRWTDFLTTDGEKPNRNRDSEFEIEADSSQEDLLKLWEDGWTLVLKTVGELTADDVLKTVTIRGEEFTVMQAISRQLTHYSYHVGQIVFLAKLFKSASWKSLSIPRGKSADFNNAPEIYKKV
ncbi:MAG TPA: DUF1572 family protein [Patescibacteria group bacterium]|nr:DUF1572 family protein [Patescibacteria group bacterium]